MIVNTNTGEVINPRRLRSNFYKPSGFTVSTRIIGIARNVGGRVRRNSFSIFAIFVILLFYMSLVAKLTGRGILFTFPGLLRYFTLIGQSVESWFLVTYFRNFQAASVTFVAMANFRFEGVLEIFNPLLEVISPLLSVGSVLSLIKVL